MASGRLVSTQLNVLGRWLACLICALLSLVVWSQVFLNSWTLLRLNQIIPKQEVQLQETQRLFAVTNTQIAEPIQTGAQLPPLERLLEAVLHKPESISVQIERLSSQGNTPGKLATTRLIIDGEASAIARLLHDLEEKVANLLVTSLTVHPGASQDYPTRWIIDGVLL